MVDDPYNLRSPAVSDTILRITYKNRFDANLYIHVFILSALQFIEHLTFVVDGAVSVKISFPDHFIDLVVSQLFAEICHDVS